MDFIKVDNCYYLWDNATFSDKENARYTYAPNIRGIKLYDAAGNICLSVTAPPYLTGPVGKVVNDSYVTGIGTFDGTGPDHSPVGILSSELQIPLDKDLSGACILEVEYATGKEEGCGQWLQVAVSAGQNKTYAYDDLLPETNSAESFTWSMPITLNLRAGAKTLRLMNHRRQENTLCSYAALLEGLQEADPENKVLLSLCEWGKTQPQNWGYKVGCSWRILNDITFQVGSDG
ncbi:MAG: alpha-galactosidase, partial [Lachnospiraceae bacterium]|nr:alpha-galactosidase [Lachnospiraceae bacterium]